MKTQEEYAHEIDEIVRRDVESCQSDWFIIDREIFMQPENKNKTFILGTRKTGCDIDESLDKDLFVEKYGRVMGEHYYNKFVHEFDGNILKMVGYFRGSEKEGQVFCDMITERIEKYEKRMSYDKGKLNN